MHRKLQRSVTEILKSVICRPNLSCSVTFSMVPKIKNPIQMESGARQKCISGVALLSNPAVLPDQLARLRRFRLVAYGRLLRFRLNPHPKFRDRRDSHGLSPLQAARSELQAKFTPTDLSPQICLDGFRTVNPREFV